MAPHSVPEKAKTAVLTALLAWAGLLLLGVALRFGGPVVVWNEDVPFARNAWAPFPGFVIVGDHVKGWSACRRYGLMAHESVHWDQQLRYLLVGMWGPFLAGKYLGLGDFHLRMEAEADRREGRVRAECAG